jgi:hypothetical protein
MKSVTMLAVALLSLSAFGSEIVSKQGGKCLNAEGGVKDGARLIAYNCSGAANENFVLEGGRLKLAGTTWCAQSDSRNSGSEVRLRKCVSGSAGDALQNFAAWPGNQIGHNTGLCLDLKGGIAGQLAANIPWVNQPAILYTCNHQANQAWISGTFKSGQTVASIPEGTKFWVPGIAGAFEKRGGKIVAQGAGNIVAQGAGNIVAQGAGNIVAQGAGN